MAEKLLVVSDLKKYFPVRSGIFSRTTAFVKAVDSVSFEILRGGTFGVVGESGCGKTTLGRTILRLIEPTDGKVIFDGIDVFSLSDDKLNAFRQKAQIVFQNPFETLNPRMSVLQIVGRGMLIHGLVDRKDIRNKVIEILEKVRLEPEHVDRFPHEFSGGQRQRIAIARALTLDPEFIVLDEPTSSVDVSVQAHILNDLKILQKQKNLTFMVISHDLSVIKHMCNHIAVMYLGKIVELAEVEELYNRQLHPYTETLISSIPVANPHIKMERILLRGDVPSPLNPPQGCRFHPRCEYAEDICKKEEPELSEVDDHHYVACHKQR